MRMLMRMTGLMLFLTVAGGAGGFLSAQIAVEPGEWISYRVTLDMESAQTIGGVEVLTMTTGNVATHLKLIEDRDESLLWQMKSRGRYHFREMGSGTTTDTTMMMKPFDYRTDRGGNVLEVVNGDTVSAGAPQSSFMSVVGGSLKNSLYQWYLPVEAAWNPVRGKKWTRVEQDTISQSVEQDSLGVAMQLVRMSRMDFVVGDVLDTLGQRVVRVDWQASGMTLEGHLVYAGVKMEVAGDGETDGSFWYSLEDGLLVAGRTDLAFSWEMMMVGQEGGTIPFRQMVHTETVRKQKGVSK